MILIFTTLNSKETARKIGKAMLEARLIACVNYFPIESSYWWKGKIEEDKEILMILKTRGPNLVKIEEFINKHAANEIPEIVAIKPFKVNKPYSDWLETEIK